MWRCFAPLVLCLAASCDNSSSGGSTTNTNQSTQQTLAVARDEIGSSNASSTTLEADNLKTGLRTQFLKNIINAFTNLNIKVDDTTCNLSQTISYVGQEMTDGEITSLFTNIGNKLNSNDCLGNNKLEASELRDLEKQLTNAVGTQYLAACTANSDCVVTELSDFSGAGVGNVALSKKIHGLEAGIINTEIVELVQSLLSKTNLEQADIPIRDISSSSSNLEALCLKNVCTLQSPQ